MKKIIMAAAVVCAAVVTQAATVKWTSSNNVLGINAASVTDNGTYAGSGDFKATGNTLSYVLTLYTAGTTEVVAQFTGTNPYGTGSKKINKSFTDSNIAQGTAYDYKIVLTGVDAALQGRGKETTYDYSAATLSATLTGSLTTFASGATSFAAEPSSWTVSGIKPVTPEPTPEPTSAMLLLLGMAGLALRRKQK